MDTLFRHWLILKMIPCHGSPITTVQITERQDAEIDARTIRSIQRELVELERHFPLTLQKEQIFEEIGKLLVRTLPPQWQIFLSSFHKDSPAEFLLDMGRD